MQTEPAEPPRNEGEEETPSAFGSSSSFGDVATAIGSRNLMIIIFAMPLVFIVVVWAIIAVFGGGGEEEAAAAPSSSQVEALADSASADQAPADQAPADMALAQEAAPATSISGRPAAISLAAGADVAAMALDGDRLALRIDGPDGPSVVIYDLAAGKVVQTIPIKQGADE